MAAPVRHQHYTASSHRRGSVEARDREAFGTPALLAAHEAGSLVLRLRPRDKGARWVLREARLHRRVWPTSRGRVGLRSDEHVLLARRRADADCDREQGASSMTHTM